MAKLVNLQINELPEMHIIGKIVHSNLNMGDNPIPALWEQCFNDGTFSTLEKLIEHHLDSSYVGWIQGLEKETYSIAHEFTQKAMEERGYKADEDAIWCMELYNCPRFTKPMESGEIILDYYIPCKKKDD